MPQRSAGRVAQLLSNNNLLSGTCVSGLSATLAGVGNGLIDAGVVVGGSSNKNNSNTNPNTTSTVSNPNNAGITPASSSSAAANGRHFGNPVAAAAAAAAAAASATASSSSSAINNISSGSASSTHHQHQPQPPPPPLITDTLNACLDVNGTYICTSYSPRCYIIQKVTPNTLTVTPHVIPGEGTSGSSSKNNSLVPLLPPPPTSLPASIKKPSGTLPLSSGGNPSSTSPASHLPPLSHHHQCNVPPPPPYGQQRQQYQHHHHHHLNSPQPQQPLGNYHAPLHHPHHHSHHHHHHIRQSCSYSQQKNSPKIATNYSIFQQKSSSSPSPVANTAPPGLPGRVYMNGEVGSSTAVFPGEESIPAMVHQSTTAAGAGSLYTENRILNGLKDGTREQMKPIESTEIDFADNSRRHDPGSGANTSSDIPKEELKRLLLQQLEYYFSPENLANDKFLVSQMDSDHYVHISTLANFNMVKKLTGDIDLVTEVLRDSKNVQVHSDGKRVRPVSHRTVVILRGIPESTPVDEIKALFDSENCPKCNSCEFAFNDSWYISFESDEDAQRAHRYLREDVKEFKGQPIMARIKSRPTTLLAQGAGVHMKNGFHQPPSVMGTYLPPSFVPGSQTGPSTAIPQTPMYGHGQTPVQPVYQMPPNFNAYPWPGLFGMGPEQFSQMYPMNGLAPQHPPSSSYPKTLPMNPRPRNPNQVRPSRRPPSSSDNQGINGVVGAGGTNTSAAVAAHQFNSNPSRKNNNAPPPTPLLSMNPSIPPPSLPLANPTSHNHSQGHLSSHSSVQVSGNAISQNGRQQHYVNPIPSSHSNPDSSYHPSGSMRPYRGGGDSRPRSSLSMSNRKGPPRREEEVSYDGPSASPSLSAKVPSSRGAPPNANIPVPPPPTENVGSNQPPGKMNFDLEGSAFPPLPGSGQSYGKNGDAVFEGRLSDVVKGVKNMKPTCSSEKDDSKASATNVTTEIIVSAEENHSSSEVREVSAASPIKDVDVEKKTEHASSQTSVQSGKKEFREVGVGSADDTHDIRSSHYKSSVLSGARSKETADKSTRTDEALLNGDQSQGVKTGVSSSSIPPQSYSHSQNGGARKSASQTTSTKSPISSKRAVPALQVQNASSSVSVGPEVPYSSRTVTSPVTTHAKSTACQTPTPLMGSGISGMNMGNSIGRGANAYVAKSNMDNNNSRANGMVTNSTGSNLNTVDKEAFPSPGFGKHVPTTKPFPTTSDQASKEATRTDAEKDKRESGQGDAKKEDCSNDERDGPMRLSYAQVAQVRKDGASSGGASASGTTVSNSAISAAAGSSGNMNSHPPALQSSSSSTLDEKKKSNVKDTKEARPPLKNQRGSGGGDRDRDRGGDSRGGFRRGGGGFRNRMMSDHSDGGSVTSGESTRRIPNKPSRSPNK